MANIGLCACGCGESVDFGSIEVQGVGFVATSECEEAVLETESDKATWYDMR